MEEKWSKMKGIEGGGEIEDNRSPGHRLLDVDVLVCLSCLDDQLLVEVWGNDNIDRVHALRQPGTRGRRQTAAAGPW